MPTPDVPWGGRDVSSLAHEQIHRWVTDGADPGAIDQARARHAARGEDLRTAARALARAQGDLGGVWRGRDAEVAGSHLRSLVARMTGLGDAVAGQAGSLGAMRDALARVQAAVRPPRPPALGSLRVPPVAAGLPDAVLGGPRDAFGPFQTAQAEERAAQAAYRTYLAETSTAARGAPPGLEASTGRAAAGAAPGPPAPPGRSPSATPGVLARAAAAGPGARPAGAGVPNANGTAPRPAGAPPSTPTSGRGTGSPVTTGAGPPGAGRPAPDAPAPTGSPGVAAGAGNPGAGGVRPTPAPAGPTGARAAGTAAGPRTTGGPGTTVSSPGAHGSRARGAGPAGAGAGERTSAAGMGAAGRRTTPRDATRDRRGEDRADAAHRSGRGEVSAALAPGSTTGTHTGAPPGAPDATGPQTGVTAPAGALGGAGTPVAPPPDRVDPAPFAGPLSACSPVSAGAAGAVGGPAEPTGPRRHAEYLVEADPWLDGEEARWVAPPVLGLEEPPR